MEDRIFGIIELLAFFALLLGFCLQQLWSLRQDRMRSMKVPQRTDDDTDRPLSRS